MPRKSRKPGKKPVPRRKPKQRLGLRVANGLKTLYENVPEEHFTKPEKDILRAIKERHSGERMAPITEADYTNMKKIAAKHRIKL